MFISNIDFILSKRRTKIYTLCCLQTSVLITLSDLNFFFQQSKINYFHNICYEMEF